MNEHLLEIKNLVIQYRTHKGIVEAVNGIDLYLDKGETIGLVGETGAGKTTTALGILRLVPDPPGKIVSGEILFEGRDLCKLTDKEMRKIRGQSISMIFQDPMTALDPVMTVGDQICEVIQLHEKISSAKATKKAMDMLEMVGIPAVRYGEYPHQFSGGMKQRVVIAIALSCNPALLLADEPTTALDVTIQAQVLEMMSKLKQELNTSMILITHDLGVVAENCDRVAIMYAGKIIESGTIEDIFDHASHPYTIGLFGSIPDVEDTRDRLTPIPGLMPDPTDLPVGCSFAPRCPNCKQDCMEKPIQTVSISESHSICCLHYHRKEI